MRSPSDLSGPKIRKAYFETSNRKMILHRPTSKLDFKGDHLCNIFGFGSRFRFLDFSFDCP